MRILVVDNKPTGAHVRKLQDYAVNDLHWTWQAVSKDDDIVEACLDLRPDAVLIDIALEDKEEERIAAAQGKLSPLGPAMAFSGIRKCMELKAELPEIPVALYTAYDNTDLARAAFEAQADQFLIKKTEQKTLTRLIEVMVERRSTCDPVLYRRLRSLLESPEPPWEANVMGDALDAFYASSSPVRRFSLLCSNLIPVMSKVTSESETLMGNLVVQLIDAQAILALVDGGLRDHVRHSGNVFWIGYLLLHQVPFLQTPQHLPGFSSDGFSSEEDFSYAEQMNYAWLIAALFHDLGYADEKRETICGVVNGMFGQGVGHVNGRAGGFSAESLDRLLTFVRTQIPGDSSYLKALKWGVDHIGRPVRTAQGEERTFSDHGLLSAVRLLKLVGDDQIRPALLPAFYQAVLAISLHNLADWHDYCEFKEPLQMEIGRAPICGLLSLCDALQVWDRELYEDPTYKGGRDTLFQRLAKSKEAYIQGSRLTKVDVENAQASGSPFKVTLATQYYLKYGDRAVDKCQEYGSMIQKWISLGKARRLGQLFGLDQILHADVIYRIPNTEELLAEFH
jgi:DNA-binding NarL/FixJ family response regulator